MCLDENIYLSGLLPDNFLVQQKKNGKIKLYFIDGVPNSLKFLIFGKLFPFLNKYRTLHKFTKLMKLEFSPSSFKYISIVV